MTRAAFLPAHVRALGFAKSSGSNATAFRDPTYGDFHPVAAPEPAAHRRVAIALTFGCSDYASAPGGGDFGQTSDLAARRSFMPRWRYVLPGSGTRVQHQYEHARPTTYGRALPSRMLVRVPHYCIARRQLVRRASVGNVARVISIGINAANRSFRPARICPNRLSGSITFRGGAL